MNKCKNCGTEFEGKFCPECGTAANAKPVCPNCGGELGENVKFCPNCGCNLASPQTAQPQAQPQVVINVDWRKIIKYLPIVFFSLWAALLWAFYSAPVTLGDGFLTETVNLYGVLKDEMMSDLYSATNALIAFAVIADVYAVVFSVAYIKGSKRLRNIFTYASFALHIAIVICAAVFGSALNTYLEGFEENSGNLVAVVIALTVVFAALQIVSVVLVRKFPSAEQEPKQRQARAKPRTPSKAKQWLSAHRTLVVVLLVVLVLGATLGTVLPITLGNIFRSGKVDKIQLGDSYAQVEKILGEPNSSTEYQYLYYSKNIADKLKEMEQIQKQAETATNFSQLSKLQSQMEKLEEELKTLEYKYIQVTFSDGKVTSVMLDTKANSNSQDVTKETKSVELIYTNSCIAKIYYTDGSYKYSAVANTSFVDNNTVQWQDDWGNYSVTINEHTHKYNENEKCIICGKQKPPYTLNSDGKTLTFGTYPQSKVEDTALQSMLNAEIQNKLPSSDNANGWTDYGYYISGEVQSYMWYVDVNYQKERYRGVYFTSYRPYYTTDSSSSTGNTYQDNNGYNTNTVYWFKWEPITWRILNNDGNKALIMSDLILDSQQYYHEDSETRTIDGKTVYPNNYKESDIRKWLNDDFYNAAFDELNKEFIIQTEVDNSASTTSSSSNQYACENTLDNVFLLSYKDVLNTSYGFKSSNSAYDTSRQLKTTDYAQCQGAYTNTGSYKGCGWWWLRLPVSDYSDHAYHVYDDGYVNYYNGVNYTNHGVVPALQIQL